MEEDMEAEGTVGEAATVAAVDMEVGALILAAAAEHTGLVVEPPISAAPAELIGQEAAQL
jgi:hypothetical protein